MNSVGVKWRRVQGSIYLRSLQEEAFLRKPVMFETEQKQKHICTLLIHRIVGEFTVTPTKDLIFQCFSDGNKGMSVGKGSLAAGHACVISSKMKLAHMFV